MTTQLRSWGNSQGIRIPKEILQEVSFSLNDNIDISVSDGKIILYETFTHKTLEERAAEYGGKLFLDGEYDWGEPVGRERWL